MHLDGVELCGIGTAVGSGSQMVVAEFAGSGEPRMEDPKSGAASFPATYDLDVDLPPGKTYEAQVGLVLNKNNCRGGAGGLFRGRRRH